MLEVKKLTKNYGHNTAVKNLSFTVKEGQIYGFLGPNGAGKTTTMNIITGYIGATEGSVAVDGHDVFEEPLEAKKRIGYLPEHPPLYTDMNTREYLTFAAGLKGVKKAERKTQVEDVMAKTDITDMADRLLAHLSKGYQQRVGLAQALLGDPKLIILDEPTVGLDPKQIIEIRDLIKSLGKEHTVILSSHILSEVAAICDHILIISKGKLVASDTPENLSKLMSQDKVISMTVRGSEETVRAAMQSVPGVRELAFLPSEEEGAVKLTFTSDAATDLRDAIFFALSDARCVILESEEQLMSLEDVFLQLTGDPEVEVELEDTAEPVAQEASQSDAAQDDGREE